MWILNSEWCPERWGIECPGLWAAGKVPYPGARRIFDNRGLALVAPLETGLSLPAVRFTFFFFFSPQARWNKCCLITISITIIPSHTWVYHRCSLVVGVGIMLWAAKDGSNHVSVVVGATTKEGNGTLIKKFFCDPLTIEINHHSKRKPVRAASSFLPYSSVRLPCCLSYDDSRRRYLLPRNHWFWLCVSYRSLA